MTTTKVQVIAEEDMRYASSVRLQQAADMLEALHAACAAFTEADEFVGGFERQKKIRAARKAAQL